MIGSRIASVAVGVITLAIVATVLTSKQTRGIVSSSGQAFAGVLRAAMGR